MSSWRHGRIGRCRGEATALETQADPDKTDAQRFPLQVSLHSSNLIYIEKKDFSQGALNTLKRLAAFPNPEFRSKQAMRISVYGVPRVLDCGYEDEEYIGLPRGCMDEILGLFDQCEVPVILEDHRSLGRSIDVEFNGVLRPEQEPAARALLDADVGVLSATTAFGKTVIGAYLIGQRKVNTLVLGAIQRIAGTVEILAGTISECS